MPVCTVCIHQYTCLCIQVYTLFRSMCAHGTVSIGVASAPVGTRSSVAHTNHSFTPRIARPMHNNITRMRVITPHYTHTHNPDEISTPKSHDQWLYVQSGRGHRNIAARARRIHKKKPAAIGREKVMYGLWRLRSKRERACRT